MSTAIAIIHQQSIIEKVAEGRLLRDIATELGVSPAAISNQLSAIPEYQQARETGAEMRLEEQYEAITDAQDMLSVSRAREGFRAASWFAEREFPKRWGKAESNQQVSVNLNLSSMFQSKISDLLSNTKVVHEVSGTSDVMTNGELALTAGEEGTHSLLDDDAPV